MKVEARLFLGLAVFFWATAVLYGFWSSRDQGHVEVAGLAALILSGGLLGITGSFFWFVSRRIDPRPEDRGDAEIAEAAGELGFFSPGSYWPLGIALAAMLTGVGFAFSRSGSRSSGCWASCSPSAGCCSSTTSAGGARPPEPAVQPSRRATP